MGEVKHTDAGAGPVGEAVVANVGMVGAREISSARMTSIHNVRITSDTPARIYAVPPSLADRAEIDSGTAEARHDCDPTACTDHIEVLLQRALVAEARAKDLQERLEKVEAALTAADQMASSCINFLKRLNPFDMPSDDEQQYHARPSTDAGFTTRPPAVPFSQVTRRSRVPPMAHNVEKLRELLARVKAADGPDREIDVSIARHFGTLGHAAGMSDEGLVGPFSSARRYTSSIDAAVRLLRQTLQGCIYKLVCEDERSVCIIRTASSWPEVMPEAVVSAATAPLAIISALLRALISQAEGEGA